mgnify:CR=1 FL=1
MKLFVFSFFEFKQQKLDYKMTDFGIDKALQELGLQEINKGTSTGNLHFSSEEVIESKEGNSLRHLKIN